MEEVTTLRNDKNGSPWGLWTTLGLSFVILVALFAVQIVVAIIFSIAIISLNSKTNTQYLINSLSSNGLLLSISTAVSTPICIGLTVLFAKLRQNISIKNYLALRKTTKRELLRWLIFLGIYIVMTTAVTYALNQPTPAFMEEIVKTSRFPVGLYIAVIVMAPLSEEFLFRGFLFQGISYSQLGARGAVLITAFVWSIIHLQYDAYYIFVLFVLGLLLGIARLKTGSLYVTILLHAINNLLALI